MLLWPFQEDVVNRIEGILPEQRRVAFSMPTGTGKTVVFTHMARKIVREGKQVLVLCPREFIADQFRDKLVDYGLGFEISLLRPGYRVLPWQRVIVGNVQTVSRRLHTLSIRPDYIFIDECHHAPSKTTQRIIDHWPNALVVGASATLLRLDRKPLHQFNTIVEGPQPRWCMENGYLCPYEAYGVKLSDSYDTLTELIGDYSLEEQERLIATGEVKINLLRAIKQYTPNRRWLLFCPTVKSSKKFVEILQRQGMSIQHMDGETPKAEQRRISGMFREGAINAISNCMLLGEGYDVPEADCVVLARRTKSLGLYMQFVGRMLRYQPKKLARLIDGVGAIEEHGLPCLDRHWSLEGTPDVVQEGWKTCPECYRYVPAITRICECGHSWADRSGPRKEKNVPVVDVDLVKLDVPGCEVLEVRRESNGSKARYNQADVLAAVSKAYNALGKQGVQALGKQLGKPAEWSNQWVQTIQTD